MYVRLPLYWFSYSPLCLNLGCLCILLSPGCIRRNRIGIIWYTLLSLNYKARPGYYKYGLVIIKRVSFLKANQRCHQHNNIKSRLTRIVGIASCGKNWTSYIIIEADLLSAQICNYLVILVHTNIHFSTKSCVQNAD